MTEKLSTNYAENEPDSLTGNPIVIFDGLCNFCSSSVQFILKRDQQGVFRFAPLQSPIGSFLMQQHGLDPADAQSILLMKDGSTYAKSDAVLEIATELAPPWRFLRPFAILPTAWRDALYDVIARNRYRWFGKRNVCYVPTADERSRFLG